MGYVHAIDLDDTRAVVKPDEINSIPDEPADFQPAQFALRVFLCEQAAADYEAFNAPEARESRRRRDIAAARAWIEARREEHAKALAEAKAALKPMTADEFLAGEWE